MNNGAIIWLVIFALSAASFLVIAAIVAVRGFGDLKTLLRHSNDREELDEVKNGDVPGVENG